MHNYYNNFSINTILKNNAISFFELDVFPNEIYIVEIKKN